MRIFRCKKCHNVVQSSIDLVKKESEDRCPDVAAPGGYWYCTYEELVPKIKTKETHQIEK